MAKDLNQVLSEVDGFYHDTIADCVNYLWQLALADYSNDEFELIADADVANEGETDFTDAWDNLYVRYKNGETLNLASDFSMGEIFGLIETIMYYN